MAALGVAQDEQIQAPSYGVAGDVSIAGQVVDFTVDS